jgi:hypothetical protein
MEVIPQMWVPTEVPKLIHQQHLRDAQNRMQYRQVRIANRQREQKSSPRRAVGLGLVRLGLWVLADVGAGTSRAARSSC